MVKVLVSSFFSVLCFSNYVLSNVESLFKPSCISVSYSPNLPGLPVTKYELWIGKTTGLLVNLLCKPQLLARETRALIIKMFESSFISAPLQLSSLAVCQAHCTLCPTHQSVASILCTYIAAISLTGCTMNVPYTSQIQSKI